MANFSATWLHCWLWTVPFDVSGRISLLWPWGEVTKGTTAEDFAKQAQASGEA